MPEKTQLYRDYASWLTAAEPRFAWTRLDRAGFRWLLTWALALFVVSSLLLWQRMQVVKLGYEISAQRKTLGELNSVHLRLQRRMQELESMPYAEKVAREQLGMANIDPHKVIYLRDPQEASFSPRALWERVVRIFSP